MLTLPSIWNTHGKTGELEWLEWPLGLVAGPVKNLTMYCWEGGYIWVTSRRTTYIDLYFGLCTLVYLS